MRYNYLMMDESYKRANGIYYPDYDILKAQAHDDEEVRYIEEVEQRMSKYIEEGREDFAGFSFSMVYVMKRACGHYELFQSGGIRSEEDAIRWLDFMSEEAKTMKCTSCICRW